MHFYLTLLIYFLKKLILSETFTLDFYNFFWFHMPLKS